MHRVNSNELESPPMKTEFSRYEDIRDLCQFRECIPKRFSGPIRWKVFSVNGRKAATISGTGICFRRPWFGQIRNYKNGWKLTPGPRPLPIIGNLHMLGNLLLRSLYHLAKEYGPIMSLRLGSVLNIVVSSSQAAKLFLKTNDVIFASHPKLQSSLMSYDSKGMAFPKYGLHWSYMRKLSALHLLSVSKVESFAPMRREKLGLLVDSLKKAATAKEVVDFSARFEAVRRNMTHKMVFGGSDDDELNYQNGANRADLKS
ncbi:hypothetical protein GH714_027458 [Hevea brasiliensis]|uniref:Cytochrome P450 n=1 Tax=Hevea brasiliensis TaxID=3981 RepID=A0A6A6LEP2_HEVBR|nr:hypothetical protein GH714_027458 [Hevea brasiliensis]